MRTVKEIKLDIREHKRGMKASGIPVRSFMNRQPSIAAARANERLFALKVELEQAEKAETIGDKSLLEEFWAIAKARDEQRWSER